MTHGPHVPAAQHPEAAGAVQHLAGEQRTQPRWFHSAFGMNCLQVNFTNPLRRKKNPYRHTQAVLRHNASSFLLYYLQEAALNGRENWEGAWEPQAVFPVVPLGWVGVVVLNTISYVS